MPWQAPAAGLKQLHVQPEERMRSVKIADRNLMGDHAAESNSRKPSMEMKRRGLDLERWLPLLRQIEIDRVIGRRTDGGRDPDKHRQAGAMNVPFGDQRTRWWRA